MMIMAGHVNAEGSFGSEWMGREKIFLDISIPVELQIKSRSRHTDLLFLVNGMIWSFKPRNLLGGKNVHQPMMIFIFNSEEVSGICIRLLS